MINLLFKKHGNFFSQIYKSFSTCQSSIERDSAKLSTHILQGLKSLGVMTPPVTDYSAVFERRNFQVSAPPGLNRTLAYLVPLMQRVIQERYDEGGRILIIVSDLEIAREIGRIVLGLSGGLRRGVDPVGIFADEKPGNLNSIFWIVTCSGLGHVLEISRNNFIKLESIIFEDIKVRGRVRKALDEIQRRRGGIEGLQHIYCNLESKDPIVSDHVDSASSLNENDQISEFSEWAAPINRAKVDKPSPTYHIHRIPNSLKSAQRIAILNRLFSDTSQGLVFCEHAKECDRIARNMEISCKSVHSKMPLSLQEHLLKSFKEKKFRVLAVTEAVDVGKVDKAVWLDPPRSFESFSIERNSVKSGGDIVLLVDCENDEKRVEEFCKKIGISVKKKILLTEDVEALKLETLGIEISKLIDNIDQELVEEVRTFISGCQLSDSHVQFVAQILQYIDQPQTSADRSLLTGKKGYLTLEIHGARSEDSVIELLKNELTDVIKHGTKLKAVQSRAALLVDLPSEAVKVILEKRKILLDEGLDVKLCSKIIKIGGRKKKASWW